MLEVARSKNVYRELHHAFLGQTLPFETDRYAAAVSTGVFTTGHVGADGLPELVRVVRPKGLIILTVKVTVWQDGFEAYLAEQVERKTIALQEVTATYESMPSGIETSPCLGVVLRTLE
jgi:hypothetical protein